MYTGRVVSRMVRKQIYIEPAQDALLKRRAREERVTEAELIRRGIDRLASVPRVPAALTDVQAWTELKAFIKRRRRRAVPRTGRAWTREDVYHERLSRLS